MAKTQPPVQQTLTVQRRVTPGTRPTRRLRAQGIVPGVIYGKGVAPVAVQVPHRELARLLHAKGGEHSLVTIRIDEGTPWEKPALVHAVQHDPVRGHILHVDFHAIVLTERIKVKVPLVLQGDPVGVKQEGGILEQFLREVEVECLPTQIPPALTLDVSALKIGDTVHVRDLAAPANTKITSDAAGVIASVQMPKEEKPEEEAAAPAEPEVLREKKEEPAAAGAEPARSGTSEGRAGEAKAEKAEKPEAKKDTR